MRDLSLKRRFWYGFFRGKQDGGDLETTTTATPAVEPPTFTTTVTTTAVPTIFHHPSGTSPTLSAATATHPSVQSERLPSAGSSPLRDQSLLGAESVPVPSKRLRPPLPPPPVLAVNVSLVEEEEEEEISMESEKDMPTLEPFPMSHEEEMTNASVPSANRDSTDSREL